MREKFTGSAEWMKSLFPLSPGFNKEMERRNWKQKGVQGAVKNEIEKGD